MKKQLGNFIVLFRPGVVEGIHSEREVELNNICEKFGGLDCKIFDPYLVYSELADAGLLTRVEQRNQYGYAAASFFYPGKAGEAETRKKIVHAMLDEIKNDPKLIASGHIIICQGNGNLKLRCLKDRHESRGNVRQVRLPMAESNKKKY